MRRRDDRSRRYVAGSVLLSIAAAMLGSSCGSSASTLDTRTLERSAAAAIRTQHGVGSTVSCPEDVPKKLGFRFWCTARLEVGSYPLLVVETTAAGRVRYENDAPLETLDVGRVRSAIERRIRRADRVQTAVSCPSTVLQREGVNFECTAGVAGRTVVFVVRQLDDAGRVRFSARA